METICTICKGVFEENERCHTGPIESQPRTKRLYVCNGYPECGESKCACAMPHEYNEDRCSYSELCKGKVVDCVPFIKQGTQPATETTKHDGGKVRMDLIPPELLFALARLYTVGAANYGDRNWEKGTSWGRMFAAAMRHAWTWWAGRERNDPESGAHHLIAAIFNLTSLYVYQVRGVGTDDRAKHKEVSE